MARRGQKRAVAGFRLWVVLDKPVGRGLDRGGFEDQVNVSGLKGRIPARLTRWLPGMLPIALGEATKDRLCFRTGLKIYRFTVAWGRRALHRRSGRNRSRRRPTSARPAVCAPCCPTTLA